MEQTSAKRRRAYLCCILAMVGWGSNFIASKIAYRAISGLTLLFIRYSLALIVLWAVYRNRPRPKLTKVDRRNILLIGAFGYCGAIALQMIGTKLVAASMASIINTITPVAIMAFAVPLLKERSSARQMLGISLTVAGSVIIVGSASGGGNSLPGIVLSFTGMILWGLTSVMIRRSCGNVDGVWLTIYATLAAVITDVPLMLAELAAEGIVREAVTPVFFAALLWIGAVGTAGANLWWSQALEVLPAAVCSPFYALLPVVTSVLGILILREKLTLQFVIGCGVIMAGVLAAVWGERQRIDPAETGEQETKQNQES